MRASTEGNAERPMSRAEMAWKMAFEKADYLMEIRYPEGHPLFKKDSERDRLARIEYNSLMFP